MEMKLKKVMAEIFQISISQIDESTTMESIEEWDSLKHMQLVMAIEEKFGIVFETEEMVEITSFTGIKDILRNKGLDI